MTGRAAVLVLAAAAAACLLPAAAANATMRAYSEGGPGSLFTLVDPPATIEVTGGDDQSIELARQADPLAGDLPVWSALQPPDPCTAIPLANGHILIADHANNLVVELDAAGDEAWSTTLPLGPTSRPGVFSAQPATFDNRSCVLVTDRSRYRVVAIDRDTKRIVWQYGTTDEPGLGVDHLMDPCAAVQLDDGTGNVLIADDNGGNRVIEVDDEDYRAGEANDGYTTDSVVWQYGTPGVSGTGVNELEQPRSPQRINSGEGRQSGSLTLITDVASDRVIAVRSNDYEGGYSADSIRWEYGVGASAGALHDPTMAMRFTSGPRKDQTMIADSGDQRIVWVDKAGNEVDALDTQSFARPTEAPESAQSDPVSAVFDQSGTLVVADPGYQRVLRAGNAGSATVESGWLDCGSPDRPKAFDRISWSGTIGAPGSGTIDMRYKINDDDDSWHKFYHVEGGRKFVFPGGATGKLVKFLVTLRGSDCWCTPVLEGFSLIYDDSPTHRGKDHGGNGPKPGAGANSGASGTYTYPSQAGSGDSGSGTGSGTSGTGPGAGTSGVGTGGSGSGAGAGRAGAGPYTPPAMTAAGPSQSVSGYQVQGLEGVSGIPLRAAGGAQAPAEQPPVPSPPWTLIIGAVVIVGLLLLVPWPLVAAKLRGITGYDHTRRRYHLPYWPLGR